MKKAVGRGSEMSGGLLDETSRDEPADIVGQSGRILIRHKGFVDAGHSSERYHNILIVCVFHTQQFRLV